jgi:hypothetical protein
MGTKARTIAQLLTHRRNQKENLEANMDLMIIQMPHLMI